MPLQLEADAHAVALAFDQHPQLTLAELPLELDAATRCSLLRGLLGQRVLHLLGPEKA
jgi:hypothetical protein